MRTAILMRRETGDDGTFGTLTTETGKIFYTGELPWRNNVQGVSCIPSGEYDCNDRLSPKHGLCYHFDAVPGRSDVEIHSGNWCGDTTKNRKSDVLGCLLLGMAKEELQGQMAVISSKEAIEKFEAEYHGETVRMLIKWADGVIGG